jgi:hypothetical protein
VSPLHFVRPPCGLAGSPIADSTYVVVVAATLPCIHTVHSADPCHGTFRTALGRLGWRRELLYQSDLLFASLDTYLYHSTSPALFLLFLGLRTSSFRHSLYSGCLAFSSSLQLFLGETPTYTIHFANKSISHISLPVICKSAISNLSTGTRTRSLHVPGVRYPWKALLIAIIAE